jgi:hypothetical protein
MRVMKLRVLLRNLYARRDDVVDDFGGVIGIRDNESALLQNNHETVSSPPPSLHLIVITQPAYRDFLSPSYDDRSTSNNSHGPIILVGRVSFEKNQGSWPCSMTAF